MKKCISLLFACCMALLLTVPAFADGRGPTFTSYDVVCTKETPYYKENWDNDGAMEQLGAFPAGTTLTVNYEYEKDDVLYGEVVTEDSGDIYEWAYIRISDVSLKDDVYKPRKSQQLSSAHSVYVMDKKGISLYSGPNKKYSVLANIPHGTKLTYEYANDTDNEFRTWAYVKFRGKTGWIYVYEYDTQNGVAKLPGADEDPEIWVLDDDVPMYSGISFANVRNEIDNDTVPGDSPLWDEEPDRMIGTLVNGKKYAVRYSHELDYYGTWYYVAAGLRAGWVFMNHSDSRFAVTTSAEDRSHCMSYKAFDLTLRETASENARGTSVHIDKNTVLDTDYQFYADDDMFYYDTIQGKSGWFSYDDVYESVAFRVQYQTEAEQSDHGFISRNKGAKPVPIYSDILERDETVGSIPVGGKVELLYSGYGHLTNDPNDEFASLYYVRYQDVAGWIEESKLYPEGEDTQEWTEPDDEEIEEEADDARIKDDVQDATEVQETVEADAALSDHPVDTSATHSSLSAMQIILICVAAAVVLALTAIVTLLLIRRKRKAPNADVPDEAAIETQYASEPTEALPDAQNTDIPQEALRETEMLNDDGTE